MKRIILVAVAALTLGACGTSFDKVTEQFNDAPRGAVNDSKADVVTFPDGFSNAATKCDNGNRVYVLFKGDGAYGSIDVVPGDPTCG